MWLLIAKEPSSDKPYWPGRRWLAAFDAVIWPTAWAIGLNHVPAVGIVGPVGTMIALGCAISRLRRALWLNHRYAFTTLRWARITISLLVMGVGLKLMMPS